MSKLGSEGHQRRSDNCVQAVVLITAEWGVGGRDAFKERKGSSEHLKNKNKQTNQPGRRLSSTERCSLQLLHVLVKWESSEKQ